MHTKTISVVIRRRRWSETRARLPTPGPANLMFFVAADDEGGLGENYPRPTADPPQCQSNSRRGGEVLAGVFVSFPLQPQ